MDRKTLIVGNWKMNGLQEARKTARDVAEGAAGLPEGRQVVICPPATLLADVSRDLEATSVMTGAQDCHAEAKGAHTGDISAEMIKDAGGKFVIVGHSERRAGHGESDTQVRDKVIAAFRADITPIICVGETEAERDSGEHKNVVARQLDHSLPMADEPFVVAYEPVWAIGTGKAATTDDIAEMHAHIRSVLAGRARNIAEETPVLYGGSVQPDNASDILSLDDVDGALVGGASLKSEAFLKIVKF